MSAVIKTLLANIQRGSVAFFLAVLLALSPIAAHADTYGTGTYNSDVYNSSAVAGSSSSSSGSSSGSSGGSSSPASSSPNSQSTVVQAPSGLQVAINLSDGQVIQAGGYYITITPINGSGKSFDKAEIYLDGALVYTGTPDSTGTLKWFWDTTKYPASKVKIIIYGPGSGTTTHEFNVTVQQPSSSSTNSSSNNSTSTPSNVLPATSGWPAWVWWVGGLALVIIIVVIWLLARRRRHDQSPPTYTPLQPM